MILSIIFFVSHSLTEGQSKQRGNYNLFSHSTNLHSSWIYKQPYMYGSRIINFQGYNIV
jgi:hypothetical protein